MCMICRGLKNHKMDLAEAEEKYQEFLDLELLDEEHQEKIEELLAEAADEVAYWDLAKKDIYRSTFEDDEVDEEDILSDDVDDRYAEEDSVIDSDDD